MIRISKILLLIAFFVSAIHPDVYSEDPKGEQGSARAITVGRGQEGHGGDGVAGEFVLRGEEVTKDLERLYRGNNAIYIEFVSKLDIPGYEELDIGDRGRKFLSDFSAVIKQTRHLIVVDSIYEDKKTGEVFFVHSWNDEAKKILAARELKTKTAYCFPARGEIYISATGWSESGVDVAMTNYTSSLRQKLIAAHEYFQMMGIEDGDNFEITSGLIAEIANNEPIIKISKEQFEGGINEEELLDRALEEFYSARKSVMETALKKTTAEELRSRLGQMEESEVQAYLDNLHKPREMELDPALKPLERE